MKKLSKRVKIFLGIILLIVIAGGILIYIYNPKKAIDLILPDLSSINYIYANVKNDTVRTKIDIIVQNKSPYKLTIDSVYFEIQLNEEQLIEERIAVNLKQERYQVDTVRLPVDFPKKKFKSILANLKGIDSTHLHANCYVIYNTIFGRVKLKYDKSVNIPVPIPPQIKVIKVERNANSHFIFYIVCCLLF